jgi:hypothetical protein
MKKLWEDWTREWSLSTIKYWLKGNDFIQIPQEYKFDEYVQQNHDDISNYSKDQQSLSSKKCMLNVKSPTLLKQFFQSSGFIWTTRML